MGIKKSELLTEVVGVPNVITPWVNFFDTLILSILDHAKNDYFKGVWNKGTLTINGRKIKNVSATTYNVNPKAYEPILNKFFNITNREELLSNDGFKKLPIHNPKIGISFTMIPKEGWGEGTPDVLGEAAFITNQNTRIVDGLIEGVEFTFNLYFRDSILLKDSFESQVRTFIKGTHGLVEHELTHAYTYYKEVSSKGSGDKPNYHFGKEAVLNWATQVMENVSESKDWSTFLKMVYWHLSFEVNARVSQLYHDMDVNDINTTEKFKSYITKTDMYRIADKLENFNAENFVENLQHLTGILQASDQLDDIRQKNILKFKISFLYSRRGQLTARGPHPAREGNFLALN
jgi:hypothetical protein